MARLGGGEFVLGLDVGGSEGVLGFVGCCCCGGGGGEVSEVGGVVELGVGAG